MAGSQQTSLLGKWLDDERASEGITTKTGGEGSIRPTPRTGGGALQFPRHPARPLSPLFYDGTQSRPADMLAHTKVQQMLAIRTTGGMERLAWVSRPHGSGARTVSR